MKIISWNVNGIRAVERKGDLQQFITTHDPDIFLIQEIKAKEDQLSAIIKKYDQYQQHYHSAEKPGYAGTAIWIKKSLCHCEPTASVIPAKQSSRHPEFISGSSKHIPFHTGMPNLNDTEGRISRITINNTEILGIYFPNGGKSPEAWQGKLEFYEKFLTFVNQLRDQGQQVIFAGDINCAHQPIDLARPKDNEGKIGFHPDERAHLTKWITNNWIDIWRERNPSVTDIYSWWHVITRSRAKNVGWRIDYFFVDEKLKDKVKDIFYLTDQMGSDHCPVQIELK